MAFLKNKIAGYKVPRKIHFLAALPKTGSGKIFKRGLKDQYAASTNSQSPKS
jgi:fatty-acyl-CoA synthase